jgi:hypothetical protein
MLFLNTYIGDTESVMFYCALLFTDERSKFLLKFLLKCDY